MEQDRSETDDVSRYRILSDIGRGGMGRVCLAEDTALRRKVALKFLTRHSSDDRSADRHLLREAQAAARLDHPFICKVYEVGQRRDEPFIAMEFVEGTTLKDRLRTGPLPLAEAVRLAAEIADALECAQTNGVVHRDLKPGNVMLTRDGHVKVLDFGIAKTAPVETGPDGTATLTRTSTAALTGTLAYMSPEQLRGEPVDSRSDIFSFGLVLYEMLTGRHPFASESALATAEAILHESAPPLGRCLKDPPALLVHLLDRLLARDREHRVQTFRDVRNELAPLAGAGGAAMRPDGTLGRHWGGLTAAVVMLAAAVVAWQVPAWLDRPALAFSERDWVVITDVDNDTGDPVFDRSLATALTVGLSQSRYVNVLSPSRVREARQRMQRPPGAPFDEAFASELALREGAKAVVVCSIAQVGTVYQLTVRLIDPQTEAPVLTESQRADQKDDVLAALDTLATRVRRSLGESLELVSERHVSMPRATTASLDALQLYADAGWAPDIATRRRLLEEAIDIDPDFAMAHAQLGLDYYLETARADRLKGEAHFQRALDLLDRLSARERLLIPALAEDSRGNRAAAVTAYRAYLTVYPDDRDVWFRLGWTQMATLAEFEPAVDAFSRVIEIDPSNSAALVNLATSYAGLHRYQEARDAYERAFAMRPELMQGIFVNHEYGFTLVRLGDLARAAEAFETMRAESSPESRARGHRSLALLDAYRGRYEQATEGFQQAVLIDAANGYDVSEFRDRLFRASTLVRRGDERGASAEIAALDTLISRLSLGPEWLRLVVKLYARASRTARARALIDPMTRAIGDATRDSTTNRNAARDQASLHVARGEIALAERRVDEALRELQTAFEIDTNNSDTLDSLAAAYLAAERLDDAANTYEQIIEQAQIANESQPYWFDAHLRLADIRLSQGDPDAARALYQAVLGIWKDADADLPALREAQSGLQRAASARRQPTPGR